MPPAFTGIVLCGGESRRMGQDKARLLIDGVPMARRVADALRQAGAVEVLAVGGRADELAAMGLDPRPDGWPGDGPLPATLTALAEARAPLVLVAACDLVAPDPGAMAAVVQALADAPEAVGAVPVDGGHRQWGHAAWRAEARGALADAFEAGARSLKRAAAGLELVEVVGLPSPALADADAPEDLPPGADRGAPEPPG